VDVFQADLCAELGQMALAGAGELGPPLAQLGEGHADVVRHLNETQVAVLKDPDLRERLAVEAVEPMPMSPEQFGQYIRADIQRWTALAKAKNIHLDD